MSNTTKAQAPLHLDDASSGSEEKHVSDIDTLSEEEIQVLVHEAKGFLTVSFAFQFFCISLVWVLFGYEYIFLSRQ